MKKDKTRKSDPLDLNGGVLPVETRPLALTCVRSKHRFVEAGTTILLGGGESQVISGSKIIIFTYSVRMGISLATIGFQSSSTIGSHASPFFAQ